MCPTRVLCALWVLAVSAEAFFGVPEAVAAAPRLRLRSLSVRAAEDKPAEAARAALESYSIPGGCRSFNRVSFQRHFSRQSAGRKGSFQERPAEVTLDLGDAEMRGRAGAPRKASEPATQ
jgi:hypothetical protein